MNKELANLLDLKSAFISHCKTLGCEDNYIKVCSNKFDIIEAKLEECEKKDFVVKTIQETIEFGIKEKKAKVLDNGDISITGRIGIVLKKELGEKERILFRKWILETCFPSELKALEIIKRDYYLVAECLDKYNSFEEMQKDLGEHCPFKTKEEFYLLKEVLQ